MVMKADGDKSLTSRTIDNVATAPDIACGFDA